MKKQIIEERAQFIVDHNVYANVSCLVERALSSGGEWECAGYSYDNIVNLYEENEDGEETCKEVMQWFSISDYLADVLEENNDVILRTDDGAYWGRTGCGYALTDDFLEIAEKIEKELGHI